MPDGGMEKSPEALQGMVELAAYLYQVGENDAALLERIERLENAYKGVGISATGIKDIKQNGNQLKIDYEDGRTAFLRVALDLPERDEVFYPWTYGLVYDNRNEVSAVTSGGGAWTIHRGADRDVPIANESPIPWDSVTLLTVSARDGDGVNRRKMFESATFDNGELIIALRRSTGRAKSDFIQVAFQMTGDVIDNGDGTYGFPVTRSTLAQSYDQGDETAIDPPLGGDYDLLLLLPDLPDIREFPSGRLAGWYWCEASADVATLLERLGERDPWPAAAVEAAEACTPGDNVPGDVVTLVRGDVASTRGWDGARRAWVVPGTIIDGNLFVHGSIQTDALAALAVTAPKIFLGNGLIAGNADALTLRIANNGGLELTPAGISILIDGNGLFVGPDGVRIGAADNSINVSPAGIAFNIDGTDSGLRLTSRGVGIDVSGNSLLVGPDGIYLNRAVGGGIAVGPDGIGLSLDDDSGTGLAVGPNGLSLLLRGNSGLVVTNSGVGVGVESVGGLEVGPSGIFLALADSSGLHIGPSGVAIDLNGNSLGVNNAGVYLRTASGGGLVVGPTGVGISVDGNSLDVGPGGIYLRRKAGGGLSVDGLGVGIAVDGNGLLLGPNGLQIGLASGSGLNLGPTGLGINVNRFGGLTIGSAGIGLLTAAGAGLTVNSAGLSLRTAYYSGLTVGPKGISLDLASGSGLVVLDNGLALEVAPNKGLRIGQNGLELVFGDSRISAGPGGIRISVAAGPPGPAGTPGSVGPPGPAGPAVTITAGNASVIIANNRISMNLATGGGLAVTGTGVEVRNLSADRIVLRGVELDTARVQRFYNGSEKLPRTSTGHTFMLSAPALPSGTTSAQLIAAQDFFLISTNYGLAMIRNSTTYQAMFDLPSQDTEGGASEDSVLRARRSGSTGLQVSRSNSLNTADVSVYAIVGIRGLATKA